MPFTANRRASSSGCRRRDLLWELGGLVYQEEGLDIEVPLEPVTLPALDRALTSEHIQALHFPTKAGGPTARCA